MSAAPVRKPNVPLGRYDSARGGGVRPGRGEALPHQWRGRVQMEARGSSGQTTVEAWGSTPERKVKDKAGLWGGAQQS